MARREPQYGNASTRRSIARAMREQKRRARAGQPFAPVAVRGGHLNDLRRAYVSGKRRAASGGARKSAAAKPIYEPTAEHRADSWYEGIRDDTTRRESLRTPRVEAGFRNPDTGKVWGTGIVHHQDELPSDARLGGHDYYETAVLIDPTGTKYQLKMRGDGKWHPIGAGNLVSRQYVASGGVAASTEGGGGGGDVHVSHYVRGDGVEVRSHTRAKPAR